MSDVFRPQDFQHLIGRHYTYKGQRYVLIGIMLGDDDWYWVMWPGPGSTGYHLSSCVGMPEDAGYELVEISE